MGDRGLQTHIDPESAEGETLLPCILINHTTPDIQRKLQKLKARPQTPLSTLVEEAFKVCNSQDLIEKANKDKRLTKNKHKNPTDLDCSDSPTTLRGPCRAKMAGRTTQKPPGPESTCFWQKGGHWIEKYSERPPVGCGGSTPTSPRSLRMSWMRNSHTSTGGARGPAWLSIPLDPFSLFQQTPGSPLM